MAEEEIPIEKLYSQPIVQELLDRVEEEKRPKNIENIKIPYVIKNKVLMSPGVWNNYYYSSQSIKDAYLKTRWDNKEVRSLFLDHLDKSSREWIGEIQNPRLRGEDLIGDLIFVDKPTAQKLAYGAKMGISPKVHGQEDNNKMVSFIYDNFSVVINPAVKTAYINNMEVNNKMAEEETKEEPKAEETKEETPKEEPKAEAPKEEAPKEETPKEETPQETESAEAIIYALSEIESKMGVADVAKKAKAIRKEGEAWSSAIKRAAKMMAEDEGEGEKKEETPKEEAPKEEPVAEESKENKEKTPEMAEADVVSQIIKLAELLKKNQKPEEEPEKDKKKKYPEPEENKEMAKMSGTIKTLSEQVTTLTKKLNEPDKVSQKTQELSEKDAITLVQKNPDAAFLNVLQRMGPGGE